LLATEVLTFTKINISFRKRNLLLNSMSSKKPKTPVTKEDLEVARQDILNRVDNRIARLVAKRELQEVAATLASKEELQATEDRLIAKLASKEELFATEKRLNDKIEILANQVAGSSSDVKSHFGNLEIPWQRNQGTQVRSHATKRPDGFPGNKNGQSL
jgi:hypothetical protein